MMCYMVCDVFGLSLSLCVACIQMGVVRSSECICVPLAPMGVALLGTQIGDTITWASPRGESKAEVVKISYQPEAAGDFHL